MSLQQRPTWSKKGDFGRVAVLGGSSKTPGAPYLSAVACLRTGVDLVSLIGPKESVEAASIRCPDLLTFPFSGDFSEEHLASILDYLKDFHCLVLGMGLPRSKESFAAVRALVEAYPNPIVLDAEALRAISGQPELLEGKSVLLTPHSEEFHILTGINLSQDVEVRELVIHEAAKKWKVPFLVKGAVDIISDGESSYRNQTGTAAMTKGGTGDVLAGICAGLWVQGLNPVEAALQAAFLNGKIGETLTEQMGVGFLASDMLPQIPYHMRAIYGDLCTRNSGT